MNSTRRAPSILTAAALALSFCLASCAAPKPAPPPPPPPVSLSPKLIEQASAYRAYMNRATAITPMFTDGAGVAQSLQAGASYEPQQLLRGAIAYVAVVALQDPAFVAGVRKFAADPTQRQQVQYAILKDPAYALGFPGANSAATLAINALGEDGRRLYDQGKLVKQAAYDVQRAPWSKAEVLGRDQRLLQAKTLSSIPVMGDAAETLRLQQASSGGAPLALTPAPPINPPYTPLVVRGLAVAALGALGAAGDAELGTVQPLMAELNAASCLTLSKLNTYQCLAVSKPYYEDVFCLGQHMMIDTGKCVMRSVGAPTPIDIKTQPLAIADATAVSKVPARKRSKKR